MNTTEPPTSPTTALSWRPRCSACGVLDGGRRVDLVERDCQRAVEVGAGQERQHVVLEDRLALLVREEGRLEPRSGVELDLAVLEVVLHVEEDRRARR